MIGRLDKSTTFLLNELTIPVCIKSRQGEFIYANEKFAEMLDVEAESITNSTAAKFLPAEIATKAENTDKFLTSEAPECELVTTLGKSDGAEIIIQIRKKLIELEEYGSCILCTFTDISQFVLYEKELEEKHRELRRQQSKLKELATIDPLTGAFNRRAFFDRAEETLRYAEVGDLEVGVLMFDLDKFKDLNDTYGHAAGDEVLKSFTAVVGDCIRSSDIFARLGGEEFALLLPDTSEAATRSISERIRKRVDINSIMYDDLEIQYTTSVGATMWHPDEMKIEKALSRSDENLYEAKRAGRNQVCFRLRGEGQDDQSKVA